MDTGKRRGLGARVAQARTHRMVGQCLLLAFFCSAGSAANARTAAKRANAEAKTLEKGFSRVGTSTRNFEAVKGFEQRLSFQCGAHVTLEMESMRGTCWHVQHALAAVPHP